MALKILLVQPDVVSRQGIAHSLRNLGYETAEAGGFAAVKQLNDTNFDLLIYDFQLPIPDKIQLALWIRANRKLIPVIVLCEFPSLRADKVLFAGRVEFVTTQRLDAELPEAIRRSLTKACRKKKGAQTWHICSNCADWPASDFEEQSAMADALDLCNECRARLVQNTCHTSNILS